MSAGREFPRLRPVEVQPSREVRGAVDLVDRAGIAPSDLTVSSATLMILSLMDGRHSTSDIQAHFMLRAGRMLFSEEIDALIDQLDRALFIEGPAFDARWAELTQEYRAAPNRPLRDADYTGGADIDLAGFLDAMLAEPGRGGSSGRGGGRVCGSIAPHLDYPCGAPCYAAAYAGLAERTEAVRFVILGTNHFGRCRSVVGTRKDFATPWGVVPCDADFMRRLDERCGFNLCEQEFDHLREHSIELQVILLHHLLGERPFRIAPYLCPDPCGPGGTAPADGRGVDLRVFAEALGHELASDEAPTCVISGADLSHVGRFFQDDRDLSDARLRETERIDRRALDLVVAADAEALRSCVAAQGNPSSICSVGCIYALATALRGRAEPRFLRYHQAVTPEAENCVTCAAIEYLA